MLQEMMKGIQAPFCQKMHMTEQKDKDTHKF